MYATTTVLTLLLGVLFVAAGSIKVVGAGDIRADAVRLGLSARGQQGIGALELCAGFALVTAYWSPLPALFGALGLTALMAGAVVYHQRAADPLPRTAPAMVLGLLSGATALLVGTVL
ncbi:DoxX family protein [Streptomyces sp. NPDC090106]|uniref:DoxX family protein n=1 Tax=Streptomyces sp. NPDC090106 TaxID=3365946 RepID=UPI00381A8E9A